MTIPEKFCSNCTKPLSTTRYTNEIGELKEEEYCSKQCAEDRVTAWAVGKISKRAVPELEPGTYKLTADVKNPKPDRRVKNDWRDFETIKAGAIFVVRVFRNDERSLVRVGDWSHQDLQLPSDGVRGELLNALLPYLERIPETVKSMLQRHGWENQYSVVLDELIEAGKITLADVETALNAWLARDDEDGKAELPRT